MTTPITAGDREPALVFTLTDKRSEADFATVQADAVHIEAFLGDVSILTGVATSVMPSADGKMLTVTRTWDEGETIRPGNWRIVPIVEWAVGVRQTFPTMILVVNDPYGPE